MNPHNHSFSSPFNVNDAVNSSAPSHLSAGSAWDGSSTTSQGDVPTHSHDCVHNYVMSWSGLTPPQVLAPGHGPDYSSAWNNSPASLSNAFNAGYDMVSAWGGGTPNIGEAFIQGTLLAQRARPPFHVSGQSFPRPIAPTPAGPGHGCASCRYNPSLAARSGPSVPPSVSPGYPGASGLNMPGAPRQPTPNVTVSPPPGFGTLGGPPVANTTPGFPFMSPPPPSFPFNPEMAGATAGQAPSVAPSSVAHSTNPARVTVSSEVNVSPYPQVDSRSRSASFQRVARWDHRRRRSRSPAAYSWPSVPGASGRGSPEPRPAVPDTGRRVAHQQPPAVALLMRPRSRQQHPPGAASQTTNSSVGLQTAARPTSPWAIDPNEIPQRSTTTTFPEPSEEQGRLCPIAGCDTSRLVRHATVQHLPWFSNPVMACWICGVQYVKGTKLKDHWRWHHRDVDNSTNWGEHLWWLLPKGGIICDVGICTTPRRGQFVRDISGDLHARWFCPVKCRCSLPGSGSLWEFSDSYLSETGLICLPSPLESFVAVAGATHSRAATAGAGRARWDARAVRGAASLAHAGGSAGRGAGCDGPAW